MGIGEEVTVLPDDVSLLCWCMYENLTSKCMPKVLLVQQSYEIHYVKDNPSYGFCCAE